MILPSESSDIGGRKTTDSNMDLSQAQTRPMILPSGSSNLGGINTMDTNMALCHATPNQDSMVVSSPGSVAIFWDIENCPVPSDVRPEDIAGNIRMALLIHPVIKGAVNLFSAYGDFNAFPRRLREGCQRTGVKLVDVPNGRKDAADKAILVDMFLFALDNPPPSSILLISGDVDFSPALHILGQRGYTVILVVPSGVGVSSALINAGRYVWDWQCVARGEGFVPPKTGLPRGSSEMSGYYMGCHIRDNMDGHIEEEAIIYRGISQNQHTTQTNLNQICYINSRDSSRVSQSLSEFRSNSLEKPSFAGSSSHNLPSGYKVSDCRYESLDETLFVQPGDINGLKGQLLKLLELSGGRLPLVRMSMEYQKIFRKPLFVADYGVFKLVDLLNKMSDTVNVEGKGNQRIVSLKQSIVKPDKVGSSSSFDQGRKDKKGKCTAEKNVGPNRVFFSDEFSDDDRTAGAALNSTCELYYRLREFKQEVQELFVSCSHQILLSSFEGLYKQRYKKTPNYRSFGVQELEELIDKVGDVAVLYEEQDSKRKFLIPNCISN